MIENENTDYSSIGSFYSFKKNNVFKQEMYSKEEKRTSGKIKIISDLLKDICEEGKSNKDDKLLLIKPFISKKIPSISINDYIERLFRYSKVQQEIFILVLIYIDRVCQNHKINLNYNNIHKIILISFIVAIKFYEDEYYSLNYYSKLGGVSKKEIINLEYKFLVLLDFNLYVKDDLFNKYNQNLDNLENDDNDSDFDYD